MYVRLCLHVCEVCLCVHVCVVCARVCALVCGVCGVCTRVWCVRCVHVREGRVRECAVGESVGCAHACGVRVCARVCGVRASGQIGRAHV